MARQNIFFFFGPLLKSLPITGLGSGRFAKCTTRQKQKVLINRLPPLLEGWEQ